MRKTAQRLEGPRVKTTMRLAARFCNADMASGGIRHRPPGDGEGGRAGRGWRARYARPEAYPGTRAGDDDGSFGRGTFQRPPGKVAPHCGLSGGLSGPISGVMSAAPVRAGGCGVSEPASPGTRLRNGHGGAVRGRRHRAGGPEPSGVARTLVPLWVEDGDRGSARTSATGWNMGAGSRKNLFAALAAARVATPHGNMHKACDQWTTLPAI
jgi:hypothetical protein